MKQLAVGSEAFQLFVRQTLIAAFTLHAAFLLLFFLLGIPVLMVANAASLLLYGAALSLIHRSSFRIIFALFWLGIAGLSLLPSEVLGWHSGFNFYLLLLIPISFIYLDGARTRQIYLVEFTILFYLFLDYHSYDKEAMVELPSTAIILLRYFNLLVCLGGLAYMIFAYKAVLHTDSTPVPNTQTDELTGLHNRYAILNKIDELFSSSTLARQPMALVIADVDHFKLLNEQYGPAVGDDILVHVAHILHDSVRHNDRASRWGGGEFLLLLPGGSLQSAENIALRAQKKLLDNPLNANGNSIAISLTFGVAELLPDEDFNQCLIRVDLALQRGKQKGRNRIELASVDNAAMAGQS